MIINDLKKRLLSLSHPKVVAILLFLAPIGLVLAFFMSGNRAEYKRMGTTTYRADAKQKRCDPSTRAGEAGASNGESTGEGIKFNIRTPLNYDPTIAHPLLMVYAPASSNRRRMEETSGLTFEATTAGFIVAYADHPQLSPTTTVELGTIPGLVAKKWCIDEKRVFLTGHSDGGTVAMALAFMAGTKHIPSAIAPSAAGISSQDLYDRKCPDPLPVMVMHSANDHLFPKYGAESSGWWAACNECDPIPEKMDNGCIAYSGCAKGVKTWYCEGNKPHAQWPGMNSVMMDFFSASGRNQK